MSAEDTEDTEDTEVIIAGSRDFNDYTLLKEVMKLLGMEERECTIISGCARGADTLGLRWAHEFGKPMIKMPADWESHGRSAGYIRNEEMAKIATHLIAFWDGQSRGTKNMIHSADRRGLCVHVHNYGEPGQTYNDLASQA